MITVDNGSAQVSDRSGRIVIHELYREQKEAVRIMLHPMQFASLVSLSSVLSILPTPDGQFLVKRWAGLEIIPDPRMCEDQIIFLDRDWNQVAILKNLGRPVFDAAPAKPKHWLRRLFDLVATWFNQPERKKTP